MFERLEEQVFDFDYKDIKYYYNRTKKADRIRVEKDKEGKDKFVGIYSCPRCSGKGESWWQRDNGICYMCRGKGYYTLILNVTKNKSTAERRLQAEIDKRKSQETDGIRKQKENNLNRTLDKYGDIFYLILDTLEYSTYKSREYLKSKGARWNPDFNCWWVTKSETTLEDFKDFELKEIITKDSMNDYNVIDYEPIRHLVYEHRQKIEISKGVIIA